MRLLSLEEKFKKIDPSLCTVTQVEDALNKVNLGVAQMLGETMYLRENNFHAPKWHGMETIEETVSLYAEMGAFEGIDPALVSFVELLYRCHDIGRLFEDCMIMTRNNAIGVPVVYANHGRAVVHLVLSRFAVSMVLGAEAQQIFDYAISHHHDRFLPELPAGASDIDRTADFFARFLRDLDMMGGLLRKTESWMNDPEKKKNEMAQYGIGEEIGSIIPVSALADFTDFKPIDTETIKNGGSWEAYMLCHLAWVINISFDKTVEILARAGIFAKYLAYFKARLPRKEYIVIRNTLRQYLNERGVWYGF